MILLYYFRRTGAQVQDKILFLSQAMAWLMCHAEMLLLTVKDHLYFQRLRNRLRDPTYRTISALLGDTRDADDITGFNREHLRAPSSHDSFADSSGDALPSLGLYWRRVLHHFSLRAASWPHLHTYGEACVWRGPKALLRHDTSITDYIFTSFYHKISGNSLGMWCTEDNITRFRRAIWNQLQRGSVEEEVVVGWTSCQAAGVVSCCRACLCKAVGGNHGVKPMRSSMYQDFHCRFYVWYMLCTSVRDGTRLSKES
jgi:hypothetical protein